MPTLRQRLSAFMSPSSINESALFAQLTPVYADTGRRALMPEWYFQAPYGQPRSINIVDLRDLAKQPFIHLCLKTIIDDFATTPYDVVAKDSHNFDQIHIDEIKKFIEAPNQNKETISDLMRQWAYDVLTVDAGVLVKVFSEGSYEEKPGMYNTLQYEYYQRGAREGDVKKSTEIDISKEITGSDGKIEKGFRPLKELGKRELLELYCRDGSTFLADGDYTGFVHRYFQYSFKLPRRAPAVFDRDEIVYTMMSPRSYSFYGWSPVQSLEDIIRTLKEAVIYSLTGLTEKGIPEGIISMLDMSKTEQDRLQTYWQKEVMGKHHKFAVVNRKAEFVNLQVTARDMEYLATQQWFIRLVMAIFNIDIPVLSLRGEAPKAGSLAILRRERMKAILPLLQLFEYEMNAGVLSEFEYDDVRFEFKTYDLEEDKIKRDMDIADVNAGILSINEVRTVNRGMDPVAWGDEPFNPILNTAQTGGFPATSMPKSLEKNPTLEEFKKIINEVTK